EEVGRLEVLVALLVAGVDRRGVDLDVGGRLGDVLVVDRHRAGVAGERSVDRRDHHVLDAEANATMARVDVPVGGECRGRGAEGDEGGEGRRDDGAQNTIHGTTSWDDGIRRRDERFAGFAPRLASLVSCGTWYKVIAVERRVADSETSSVD